MIKKYLVIIALVVTSFSLVNAQQDVQYSQYMLNSLYVNPASAGIDGMTKINFIYRDQWTGNPSAPKSFILAGQTKLHSLNSGIGAFIQQDKTGPLESYNLILSYSYHLNLGGGKLGIGINGGGLFNRIDANALVANDPNDVIYTQIKNKPNSRLFDLGGGLWYHKEKYYAGVSTSHINNPNFYRLNNQRVSTVVRHLYLTGGYNFDVSEKFRITPSAIVKTDLTSVKASSFEVSALGKYDNEKFWGGLSFRQGDALTALIGVGFLKNNAFKIGYAFDVVTVGNASKGARTSNEIFVSYSMPVMLPKLNPPIRTPRFRF